MEFSNDIAAQEPLEDGVCPEVRKGVLELLILMLAPMTPHLAEELWEMLGHSNGLWTVAWPAFSEELAKEEEIEIPVQVNGKLRSKIKAPVGLDQDSVIALARQAVASHLNGKQVVKAIVVQDRLVNLVVK